MRQGAPPAKVVEVVDEAGMLQQGAFGAACGAAGKYHVSQVGGSCPGLWTGGRHLGYGFPVGIDLQDIDQTAGGLAYGLVAHSVDCRVVCPAE